MSLDSSVIRRRVQDAGMRAARLQGVRQSAVRRSEELRASVSLAKGRLGLAEEVARIFDALQTKAHERSVGALQRLLSAILGDVLPNEGLVRLIAQVKANATWLDVALEKSQGHLEDVLDGNGGAVTNVISAGLRFAALSRTQNRRLMILDEPDCWLKPQRVPAFVNVIAQVSEQTQTQTFFITHHEPELLQGRVNVVQFTQTPSGGVRAAAELPLVHDWQDDETPGIRSIELFNVRRHAHTVVPCYPGATAIIGDNNLGKSTAIATTFKAVAYGESDDSIIRHDQQEARIVIRLENNLRLEWSRALKRSPSVLYKLYDGDELVCEGRQKARNQSPDWVTDILGVARVDDLDIQVGSQKSPVFLLDDSAPRRAQILSVGRESGHLKTLMRKYEERRVQDRETVKSGELELARLTAQLGYLAKAEDLLQRASALSERAEGLLSVLESLEQLHKSSSTLGLKEQGVDALLRQATVLQALPEVPGLYSLDDLVRVSRRIEQAQRFAGLPALPALPAVPALEQTADLSRLGQRMAQALAKLNMLQGLPVLPEAPGLSDTAGLQKACTNLPVAHQAVAKSEKDLASLAELAHAQEQQLRATQKALGHCPLCDHVFEDDHAHA